MHFFKSILISGFLLTALSCGSQKIYKYDYTPVLLHLTAKDQPKPIGFNLPKEIPILLYDPIVNGIIPLWKDPSKSHKISVERFRLLDQQSVAGFKNVQNVFFHEHWSIVKKLFAPEISGISFVGNSKNGSAVSFGFIDIEDVFPFFTKNLIPNNANGNAGVTYWEAIKSRKFTYNLVQFGKDDFKANPMRSFELMNQAEFHPKLKRNNYVIPEKKKIIFNVVRPEITSNTDNDLLFSKIKRGLMDNSHILFNKLNVRRIEQTLDLKKYHISLIEIHEIWSNENNFRMQNLSTIVITLDDDIIELNKSEIDEMNIEIKNVSLEEFISYKSFDFIITKINHQSIKPVDSKYYYNALLTKKWYQID